VQQQTDRFEVEVTVPRKVVVHSAKKRKADGEDSATGKSRKKRRPAADASSALSDEDVGELATAHAIPVSDISNRVLFGKLDLNQLFPKNHASPRTVKKPPVPNMSISSAYHAVRTFCSFLFHFRVVPFYSTLESIGPIIRVCAPPCRMYPDSTYFLLLRSPAPREFRCNTREKCRVDVRACCSRCTARPRQTVRGKGDNA
jgi:hypothetical protein